jgi:hypothetical protein
VRRPPRTSRPSAPRRRKKGRARGRAAYNAELEAGLDRQALADALARVLAEREAAPAPRRRRGGPATGRAPGDRDRSLGSHRSQRRPSRPGRRPAPGLGPGPRPGRASRRRAGVCRDRTRWRLVHRRRWGDLGPGRCVGGAGAHGRRLEPRRCLRVHPRQLRGDLGAGLRDGRHRRDQPGRAGPRRVDLRRCRRPLRARSGGAGGGQSVGARCGSGPARESRHLPAGPAPRGARRVGRRCDPGRRRRGDEQRPLHRAPAATAGGRRSASPPGPGRLRVDPGGRRVVAGPHHRRPLPPRWSARGVRRRGRARRERRPGHDRRRAGRERRRARPAREVLGGGADGLDRGTARSFRVADLGQPALPAR